VLRSKPREKENLVFAASSVLCLLAANNNVVCANNNNLKAFPAPLRTDGDGVTSSGRCDPAVHGRKLLNHAQPVYYNQAQCIPLYGQYNAGQYKRYHTPSSLLAPGPKNLFCVQEDELLRAKDDLLSEGGQSL